MKRIITSLFIIAMLFLSACNNDSTDGGSYQSIININGNNYYLSTNGEKEFSEGELIGTIEETVKPENIPTKHLTSNQLDTGTEIYSTKESEEYFIAKEKANTFIYTLEKNIESSD